MNKVVPIAVVVLLATLGLSAYAYTYYLPALNGSNSSTGPSGLGGPGTGTLNIYLADSPHTNATLKYLLVNVTSVTLKYSSFANETGTTTTTSATSGSSSSSSTGTTTTSSSSSSSTSTSSSSTGQNGTEHSFVFQVPSSVGTNVNITKLQGSSLFLGAPKVPAGNVTGIIFQITGAKAFWTNGNSTQLKVVADGKFMVPVLFVVHADGTTTLTVDITPNSIHISQGNMTVLTPVIHVEAVSTGSNGSTETTQTSETESSSSTSG